MRGNVAVITMGGVSWTYLVESYSNEQTDTAARARAAHVAAVARELREQGHAVALLGCLLVPDDEVCFWRFAGSSIAAVEAATRRAGLDVQRITRSVEIVESASEPSERPDHRGAP
jgi:hypothetical protein